VLGGSDVKLLTSLIGFCVDQAGTILSFFLRRVNPDKGFVCLFDFCLIFV
jgi:hypothetical protein